MTHEEAADGAIRILLALAQETKDPWSKNRFTKLATALSSPPSRSALASAGQPKPGLVEAAREGQRVLASLEEKLPNYDLYGIEDEIRAANRSLRSALAGEEWEEATKKNAIRAETVHANCKVTPAYVLMMVDHFWPDAIVMRRKVEKK